MRGETGTRILVAPCPAILPRTGDLDVGARFPTRYYARAAEKWPSG
jgi:hypothetical protein